MHSLPPDGCDLIYVDPPFNASRIHSTKRRAGTGFPDQFEDLHAYLEFLKPRLAAMKSLLTPQGSLYVHLDARTVHYVKVFLDELFGADCFLNEIIWHYRSGGRPARWFARKHDTILLYARSPKDHVFNRLREGSYRTRDLKYTEDGTPYKSTRQGPIYFHPDGPAMTDVWNLPILSTVSKERTGYPTQKPETLLERIILASTHPGQLVADFFCGSGTTLAVAQRLKRKWLGCDVNHQAVEITQKRLGLIGT